MVEREREGNEMKGHERRGRERGRERGKECGRESARERSSKVSKHM